MTSLAEISAKLKHPARQVSLSVGAGLLVGSVIVKDKAFQNFLVGAGVTMTGITLASLLNPIHISAVEDTQQTRKERDVSSKGIGQSGSCWDQMPRPEAPAEVLAATSMDEYLTGKPDKCQLNNAPDYNTIPDFHATQDVQTRYQREGGLIPGQTYGPEMSIPYQNAVLGRGINVAMPRIRQWPEVETRTQSTTGQVVGQSGTFREGQLYAHARYGNLAPPMEEAQYPLIPKNITPLSGIEQFNKVKLGQNYPGQAIGFRV